MMAFPANPVLYQSYVDPTTRTVYVWDGTQWVSGSTYVGSDSRVVACVETAATLRTYRLTDSTCQGAVQTLGALTPGDGGGGLWMHDAASAATDNTGTVLDAQGGGKWIRVVDGPIEVRWFGAVGDGVADDTAAIKNAIAAGDRVHFHDGSYKISSTIQLRDGVHLIGDKRSKIVRDTTVTPFDMMVGVSVYDVIIELLHFDGVAKTTITQPDQRYCALRFWDNGTGNPCEDIWVINCRFDKTTNAEIQPEGNRGVIALETVNNVRIENCSFHDNRGTCIFWMGTNNNIDVNGCYCLGEQTPYDPTFKRAGSFCSGQNQGRNLKIAGNTAVDTGYSAINATGNGVFVIGNVVSNGALSGISVGESTAITTDATVSGNIIHDFLLDGITIFPGCKDSVFIGNTINRMAVSSRAGINFYENVAAGAPIGHAANLLISSNTINGCYYGILCRHGQEIYIMNNQFNDTIGAAITAQLGTNYQVQDLLIQDNAFNSGAIHIDVRKALKVDVIGNTFKNSTTVSVTFRNQNLANEDMDITLVGNTFVDNNPTVALSIMCELNSTATAKQTAYISGNTVISSNIAIFQRTAFYAGGANSFMILGSNTFSENYDTSAIEISWPSRDGKAFYADSAALPQVGTMKFAGGKP